MDRGHTVKMKKKERKKARGIDSEFKQTKQQQNNTTTTRKNISTVCARSKLEVPAQFHVQRHLTDIIVTKITYLTPFPSLPVYPATVSAKLRIMYLTVLNSFKQTTRR